MEFYWKLKELVMSQAAISENRLVLSDGSVDPEAGRAAGLASSASPLILGLIAPIVVLMVIDPSALRHAQFLIVAILLPLLFASIAIYAYSVLNPGDVAGLLVDPAERAVVLTQANGFASRRTAIAFEDIVNARIVANYDRDGYATTRGELALQSGERILLPAGMTEAHLKALRLAVGLR